MRLRQPLMPGHCQGGKGRSQSRSACMQSSLHTGDVRVRACLGTGPTQLGTRTAGDLDCTHGLLRWQEGPPPGKASRMLINLQSCKQRWAEKSMAAEVLKGRRRVAARRAAHRPAAHRSTTTPHLPEYGILQLLTGVLTAVLNDAVC